MKTLTLFSEETSSAVFSPCRQYRYRLERHWADGPVCVFCMLNPSTADEVNNDPTVTRCINFAKSWECGTLVVVNIFAFRSTDPKALKTCADPIGPENNHHIGLAASNAKHFICAWGVHGELFGRGREVASFFRTAIQLQCLGKTKSGHPKHPLYLKADIKPVAY